MRDCPVSRSQQQRDVLFFVSTYMMCVVKILIDFRIRIFDLEWSGSWGFRCLLKVADVPTHKLPPEGCGTSWYRMQSSSENREERYQRLFGFEKDENGKEAWKKEMQKNEALLKIYKGSHNLAASGKASSLKSLIDSGTDINEQDAQGDTFLHLAVRNKQKNLYEKLIQWGCKLEIKNSKGEFPLDGITDPKEQDSLRKLAPADTELCPTCW